MAENIFTDSDIGARNPMISPVDGYEENSNSYINPFLDDKVQFQINASNFNDYLTHLLPQVEGRFDHHLIHITCDFKE